MSCVNPAVRWVAWDVHSLLHRLTYLLDLRAVLGFERWQSANKGLPLGSVKDHLGSIGGVEASRIDVVLDGISPSRFGATSWSFPAMNYWVEVVDYYQVNTPCMNAPE